MPRENFSSVLNMDLFQKREYVDHIMNEIVTEVSSNNLNRIEEINESNYRLGKKNFPCYKSLMTLFSNQCFNVAKVCI